MRLIHRPMRRVPPGVGGVKFSVPPIPERIEAEGFKWSIIITSLMGGSSFLAYGLMSNSGNGLYLKMGVVFISLTIVAGFGHRTLQNYDERKVNRKKTAEFHSQMDRVNRDAAAAKVHVLEGLVDVYPSFNELDHRARGPRLWERRIDDDDFLTVRFGDGTIPSGLSLEKQASRTNVDPNIRTHVEAVETAMSSVAYAPVVKSLRTHRSVAVVGDEERARATLLSLVSQLMVACGPDELQLIVLCPPRALDAWKPIGRFPHAAGGNETLVFSDLFEFEAVVSDFIGRRLSAHGGSKSSHEAWSEVLLVIEGYNPRSELQESELLRQIFGIGPSINVSALSTCRSQRDCPESATLWCLVDSDERGRLVDLTSGTHEQTLGTLERAHGQSVSRLAEYLCTCELATDAARVAAARSERLLDSVDREGRGDTDAPELNFVFGIDTNGRNVAVDIREAGAGGEGPHGLVVGATGSGKSELLRTIVSSAALSHSSDDLALLFIDFKGGATFDPMATIPHCTGLITNLEGNDYLIDRMRDAILGELKRRQREFNRAGTHVKNLAGYREQRRVDPNLPVIPNLLIVADEVGELLTARDDFFEVFVKIARVGRSLGVHLLLATQRLEGRMPSLCSHLSYRICLKTFTAEDSVTVLGTRDAYELPGNPGVGYFKAFSGPREFAGMRVDQINRKRSQELASKGIAATEAEQSDLAAIVASLQDPDSHTRRLWLDPFPDPFGDECLSVSAPGCPDRDIDSTLAIGHVDRPLDCEQPPLCYDPTRDGGNLLIVGSPQSGKTNALQSLALTTAIAHDDQAPRVLAMDFASGELLPLGALRSVAAVAPQSDMDMVDCVVAEAQRAIQAGFGGTRTLLMIDGVASLRSSRPDLEPIVAQLIEAGPSRGLHTVVTATRVNDLPMAWLDRFGQRLELHIFDPSASVIDRRLASTVPANTPGRCITLDGDVAQLFRSAPHGCSFREAVATLDQGQRLFPKVSVLSELDAETFEAQLKKMTGLPCLGLSEADFEPVPLDPESPAPLHVIGSSQETRGFVARLSRELDRTEKTELYYVDLEESPAYEAQRPHHAVDPGSAKSLLASLVEELTEWWEAQGQYKSDPPRRRTLVINGFDVIHEIGFIDPTTHRSVVEMLAEVAAMARFHGLKLVLVHPTDGFGQRVGNRLYMAAEKLGPDYLLFGNANHEIPSLIGRGRGRRPTGPGVARLLRRDGSETRIQTEVPA